MTDDPEITDPRDPMKRRDIVAELEHWLDQPAYMDPAVRGRELDLASWLIRRARNEIVALRKALHAEMMGRPDKWHAFIAEARDEALEEAARACEGGYTTGSTRSTLKAIAAAIRALKGTGRDE